MVEVLALEARAEAAEVAGAELALPAPVAGEQAAGEHPVGGDSDAQLPRGGQDFGLDAAGEQRVLDLQVGDRVDGVGAAQGLRADLGQADVADQAGLHHLGDRADGLLDRDGRVEAGRAVDVDVVGAEAVQRVRERGLDRGGAGVVAEPVAERVALGAELDADHGAVAVAAAQGLAQQQFVVAHAVEVASVEQGDAGVEGGVDGGDRLGVVGRAVGVRHAHQAEAEGGDDGSVGAEGARVHGVPRPGGGGAALLAALLIEQ